MIFIVRFLLISFGLSGLIEFFVANVPPSLMLMHGLPIAEFVVKTGHSIGIPGLEAAPKNDKFLTIYLMSVYIGAIVIGLILRMIASRSQPHTRR